MHAMTFTKSLKQFVRTPLTASVFLVMFAIASFFVSCGAIIWARNQAVIKAYEDVFVTIGTVRQLPTRIDIVDTWDADMKDYRRASRARYSSPIPVSVLDFDGADYIYRSEKRPFYGAWRPDLKLYLGQGETKSSYMSNFVVEVAPLEDCVPSGPVQVRIERVLFTELLFNQFEELQPGEVIYLCDHNNDAPQPLYADRTYLMVLIRGAAHASGGKREFHPETITFSTQYRPDGTLVSGEAIVRSILEVNKDATDEMRLWLNYAANMNNAAYTIPVLPTAATHLLIPFYNGSAFMVEGEDITAEEYEDGARVCLISENFASMNGIGVGDMLRLPLYYADYRYAPSDMFLDTFSLSKTVGGIFRWYMGPPLNAAGEPYGVFSDHEYVVKGVYSGDHTRENSDALGANTVVVPAASIRESDTDNITEFGPMKHSTTTFEIPNGSIDSFMENWLKTGREEPVRGLAALRVPARGHTRCRDRLHSVGFRRGARLGAHCGGRVLQLDFHGRASRPGRFRG